MRTIINTVVEYENDLYANILKDEITNASIQFHLDTKNVRRSIYNFNTGEVDIIDAVDEVGEKLAWLINEYVGYTKENYPELFS